MAYLLPSWILCQVVLSFQNPGPQEMWVWCSETGMGFGVRWTWIQSQSSLTPVWPSFTKWLNLWTTVSLPLPPSAAWRLLVTSGFYVLGVVREEFSIYKGFTVFPWPASWVLAVDNFAGEPDLDLNIGFLIRYIGIITPNQHDGCGIMRSCL